MKNRHIFLPLALGVSITVAQLGFAQSARQPSDDSPEATRSSRFTETVPPTRSFYRSKTRADESNGSPVFETIITKPPVADAVYDRVLVQTGRRTLERFENDAVHELKQAKDDEAKRDVRDKIRQRLSEQYDKMLDQQEKQIDAMEDRLNQLRDQLSRRKEAKSRMVDLKLETIVSRADGLGWPDANIRTETVERPADNIRGPVRIRRSR